jgi:hypothetical protein
MMTILIIALVLIVIPALALVAGEDSRFTHNPLS